MTSSQTLSEQFATFNFDQILSAVASHCRLAEAREKYIFKSSWQTDASLLNQLQEEIRATKEMLDDKQMPAVVSIESISDKLDNLGVPQTPFPLEGIADFQHFLAMSDVFARAAQKAFKTSYAAVKPYFEAIIPLPELNKAFSGLLDTDGNIADTASGELKRIRRQIKLSEQKVFNQTSKLLTKYSNLLQSDQPALRNERMVLPVKDRHLKSIPGIIHGRSSSGQTLFIEPAELMEINNQLDGLRSEEYREIHRILVSLADLVRTQVLDIRQNWETLCYLDALSAKVHWAVEFAAHPVSISTDRTFNLIGARHPLLVKAKSLAEVVPLQLEMNSDKRMILVTGPNAGGKTVLLKTVAISLILAHSGFPVPAAEGTILPLTTALLFDIGDNQSLSDDLSTFSAHLTKLRTICEKAGDSTFVCIDEMGTGTDPQEGVALSRAILEWLLERQTYALINSHHGALKLFAHEHEGMQNASMEFDRDKLMPTFRFIPDVPGSSYALEIAKRLDFPDAIVDRSRSLLGTGQSKIENLISDLQNKIARMQKDIHQLELDKSRYLALEKLYKQKMDEYKQTKDQLKQKATLQAQEIVNKANATIENLVREIREQKAGKSTIVKAKKTLQQLKEDQSKALAKPKVKANSGLQSINVGDTVNWDKMGVSGEVVEVLASGKVLISSGNAKLTAPKSECTVQKTAGEEKQELVNGIAIPTVSNELDIRGIYADEVGYQLQKFIGDTIAANWQEVRIIHGKGTGALQTAVQQFLKKDKRIKSFRAGQVFEGGAGATVAILK
jgi:DNA mismatch repair protein MutS2